MDKEVFLTLKHLQFQSWVLVQLQSALAKSQLTAFVLWFVRSEVVGFEVCIIQSELIDILFGSPWREMANWMGHEIENHYFLFQN